MRRSRKLARRLGLTRSGMVNLALIDKVLEVDKGKKRVRVQAGISIQQLVDGIKDGLQNFASLREQKIDGIIQVGAHGTGARLPPIDKQFISMKLVTPAKGTVEIAKRKGSRALLSGMLRTLGALEQLLKSLFSVLRDRSL